MIIDCISDKRSLKTNTIERFLYIISQIQPDENGCKVWPMGINSDGYGHFSIKDKSYNVSRLLYKTIYAGEYKEQVVRHKCDNRACCNIEHLEIGTQKDNILDASKRNRLRVGERNNKSILNDEKVLYIRKEYPKKSTSELSKELGINPSCINSAICGKTWAHLPNKKQIITNNKALGEKASRAKLNEIEVLEIRSLYPKKNGLELSRLYNVSHGLIYGILNRKIWKHI